MKQLHEVLAQEQERLPSGVLPQPLDREALGISGVFREPLVDRGDSGIEVRRLVSEGPHDSDNEVEERCDSPLFLFEQGHRDAVVDAGRLDPIHQAMVGEGQEVGFARTPWPDQENVVFLWASNRRGDARQHVVHDIVTPDEQGLQGLAVHVPRAVA